MVASRMQKCAYEAMNADRARRRHGRGGGRGRGHPRHPGRHRAWRVAPRRTSDSSVHARPPREKHSPRGTPAVKFDGSIRRTSSPTIAAARTTCCWWHRRDYHMFHAARRLDGRRADRHRADLFGGHPLNGEDNAFASERCSARSSAWSASSSTKRWSSCSSERGAADVSASGTPSGKPNYRASRGRPRKVTAAPRCRS